MKKIINGKRYDTETAKELGYWYNGRLTNDMYYFYEALFRKKSGEYFRYGSGGSMTDYCSEEEIKPMSEKEARKWAEKMLSGDEYEEIFGEVDESREDVHLSFAVDVETNERLCAAAQARGLSVPEMLKDMVSTLE